jgi:putative flippase GtrA
MSDQNTTKLKKEKKPGGKLGREAVSFIIVGIFNTLLGLVLMFVLYNFLHTGYWLSSAISYVIGSIISYILNKKFTFRHEGDALKSLLKFAVNIAVCYLIAYSVAKPFITFVLSSADLKTSIVEQIAMLFGMCVFTGLNFIGQKFFAFAGKKKGVGDDDHPEENND